VLGGMIVGVLLGVFFIPLFFVVIQRLFGRKAKVVAQVHASKSREAA
jgi:multidrug efflux pump